MWIIKFNTASFIDQGHKVLIKGQTMQHKQQQQKTKQKKTAAVLSERSLMREGWSAARFCPRFWNEMLSNHIRVWYVPVHILLAVSESLKAWNYTFKSVRGVNGAVQGWMSGPGCLSVTVTDCRPALPCWLTVRVLETPLSLPILGRIPDRHACRFQLLADCSVCWLDCRGCYSHTGGSANPLGCPAEREWWWPGAAGFTEQQIEMNWTPRRGEWVSTSRKMTVTLLQVCAVITEKGRWHPSAAGEEKNSTSPSSSPSSFSSPSSSSSSPSGFALGAGSEVMTWQKWIHSPNIDCEVKPWHDMQVSERITRWQYTQWLRTVPWASPVTDGLDICGAEDETRENLQ